MRVLVATNDLQGTSPDDYAFTVDGELVAVVVAECDDGDRCGCSRGFPGIASNRATTTAAVVELEHVTRHELRAVLTDWVERSGWSDMFRTVDDIDDAEVDELVASVVDEHIDAIEAVAESFPVGTIIERTGTEIRSRSVRRAA